MSEQALVMVKAQRDRLAAAYHDLQVEHVMTSQALADISRQLAAAQARIAEPEQAARDDDSA